MDKMRLDESGRMIIEDYTKMRPFSSFLPGMAGPMGTPMWVFYVNRGQAIASFGVESKDHPILEFQPANKAYRDTEVTGFRTFIKFLDPGHEHLHEPFSSWHRAEGATQRMLIGMNELALEERHPALGLQTQVSYFTLPGENYAGLVRKVAVKNLSGRATNLEVLDGLPAVIPFGVNNSALKEIGRTIEAWMGVYNLDQGIPFYRLGASAEDTARVERIEAGHFALSFCLQGETAAPLPAIVDPDLVFGRNTAFSFPDRFNHTPLEEILERRQITNGKTPSGFFGTSTAVPPNDTLTIYTIFGHSGNQTHLSKLAERLYNAAYLEGKRQQANDLAAKLTDSIATKTGLPLFDAYCRQTFLDNVIRGGWPILFENNDRSPVYHIYSRKHGDLERDYNAFHLAPEPYSQGELNYRDVNQNRRSDVLFNPRIGGFNIRAFMGLIQADGYNPLVIKGVKFTLPQDTWAAILKKVEQPEKITPVLGQPFTAGRLLRQIADHDIGLQVSPEEFLASVLQHADHQFEAAHGEGYWVDHWTYNLDLIDNFLTVYPDRKNDLLFGSADIPFYDSPYVVRPRDEKYVLADSKPRQYEAVKLDSEKPALIDSRAVLPNWMRVERGHGEIYRTTLFVKLFALALIKFTTLDPYGMGIEMEAGKPGWYDAVNGLPGLFGSSMPESYELLRLIKFLLTLIEERDPFGIEVPIEIRKLMDQTLSQLEIYDNSNDPARDFRYWDDLATAREAYRAEIRLGFAGASSKVTSSELLAMLGSLAHKVNLGIERALSLNHGFPPTYFAYEAESFEILQDEQGAPLQNDQDLPYVRIVRFKANVLPAFLEGAVKDLKLQSDPTAARERYQQVKAGPLYDHHLKMYKVNASLEAQPHEIGRARAFPRGWLENESIWLHMEYKYLLEVLKSGLYAEFFEDFKNALIPFQDPERYGRSPLENSSFLVSSAHPDESLHGGGFVARLSGATAEFLSLWGLMMAGAHPFYVEEGQLHLRLRPALPQWLLTLENIVSFTFLGHCHVTYHNLSGADLLPDNEPKRITLTLANDHHHTITGPVIPPPYAEQVRTGKVSRIEQFYE